MKKQRVVQVGAVAAVVVLTGCATKGHVRSVVDEERAAREAAMAQERSERMAADDQLAARDEALAAQLATLRNDLATLREEFGAKITAVEEGLSFAFPVHFYFDDATVRPEDVPALERFADVVSRHYTGSVVTIEGFADPAGAPRYNEALSARRAEAVRDQLMGQGIQAQLRAVGYGEDRPVVPGAERDDPGAELNRRVVFVVESPAARRATISEGSGTH